MDSRSFSAISASPTGIPTRYYFDGCGWSRLIEHPERTGLVRSFGRKRRIYASLINAVEILQTPDSDRRAQLCAAVMKTIRSQDVILPFPGDTVAAAVTAFRSGEKEEFELRDDALTTRFRHLLEHPHEVEPTEKAEMSCWIERVENAVGEHWRDVPDGAFAEDIRVTPDLLSHPKMAELLLGMDISVEFGLKEEDLPKLFAGVSAWAAMVCSIAALVAQTMRVKYSKTKARKLPNARDILQLTYMGVANRFLTDDAELFRLAKEEIAPFLPGVCDVYRPTALFAKLGYF